MNLTVYNMKNLLLKKQVSKLCFSTKRYSLIFILSKAEAVVVLKSNEVL